MATCDISISEERTIAIFTVRVSWRWQQFIRPKAANTFWWSRWQQCVLSFVVISNEGRYAYVGNMSTGYLQNAGVDTRIILKYILKKYMATWTAFIWLRIWSMAGSWNYSIEFSDSKSGTNFLTFRVGEIFGFLIKTLVDGRTVRLCANARKETGVVAAFWTWNSVRNIAGDFNACIRHNIFSCI
jgi:hypothetical protein